MYKFNILHPIKLMYAAQTNSTSFLKAYIGYNFEQNKLLFCFKVDAYV